MNGPSDASALLAQLAGLSEPPPISWWPLAWGWWVTAFMSLLAALILLLKMQARAKRRRWRILARAELDKLEHRLATGGDRLDIVSELSVLLRRVALLHSGRAIVARAHGEAWLALLNSMSGSDAFTRGPGTCLVHAPYGNHPPSEGELVSLLALSRNLIERLDTPVAASSAASATVRD